MHAAEIAAGLIALIAYFCCLPPGVAWWDTAEAQTVPYIAGIFHPTGFPAYAMAGWIFSHVFAIGNVAWRMSAFSAVLTAIAVALLVRSARTLGADASLAFLAGLTFALLPAIWQHATRAGVDAMTLCVATAALTCALERRIVACAFFAGLGLATHPVTLWLLPGVAIVVLAARPALSPIALLRAAGAAIIGLLAYAYLPIRSAVVTARGLDPTAALPLDYHPMWDYDHPSTTAGFVRLVSGADFHVTGTFSALGIAAIGSGVAACAEFARAQVGYVGIALALAGCVALGLRPGILIGLLVAAFGVFPFARNYQMLTDPAKYELTMLWITLLIAAYGATAVIQFVAERRERARVVASAAMFAAFAAVLVVDLTNAPLYFDQRSDTSADAIIASVQRSTSPNAVIVTPWWYATPLFYAAYVDHALGNRLIATNVDHDEMTALARTHDVYYFPLPPSDIDITGARLERIAGAWPDLYHVQTTTASIRVGLPHDRVARRPAP